MSGERQQRRKNPRREKYPTTKQKHKTLCAPVPPNQTKFNGKPAVHVKCLPRQRVVRCEGICTIRKIDSFIPSPIATYSASVEGRVTLRCVLDKNEAHPPAHNRESTRNRTWVHSPAGKTRVDMHPQLNTTTLKRSTPTLYHEHTSRLVCYKTCLQQSTHLLGGMRLHRFPLSYGVLLIVSRFPPKQSSAAQQQSTRGFSTVRLPVCHISLEARTRVARQTKG